MAASAAIPSAAGATGTLSGSAAAAGSCAPVWFIGARGSGESAHGYRGMGPEVYYMASVVSSDLADKGLRMASMPVSYPADSVYDLKPNSTVLALIKAKQPAAAIEEYIHTSIDKYDSSMTQGINQAEADVAAVVSSCPSAKIIMGGYSQGAVAVHDAENWLARNRLGEFKHVAGTLLLGDPDRVPDTKARRFGDSAAGAEGLRVYLRLVKAHDVPAPASTANIANTGDIVGDFSGIPSIENYKADAAVHTSYASTVVGKRLLAKAADWVASLIPGPAKKPNPVAVEAPLPPDAAANQYVVLGPEACPSATACVVAGQYSDTAGDLQLVLLTGAGNSWTAAEAPLPAGAVSADQISAVACPSAATCVAVASYLDASGNTWGVVLTGLGNSWNVTQVPFPGNADTANPSVDLTALACPTTAACVAAGTYQDKSGAQQAMLLTGHGDSWSAVEAKLPGNATEFPEITSMACPTATRCVAAGQYNGGGGEYKMLLTGVGDSWSVVQAPLPAGGVSVNPDGEIESVACPSLTTCVATGGYSDSSTLEGMLLTGSGSSWTAVEAPVPPLSPNRGVQINALTCPSAAKCVAAGIFNWAYATGDANPLGWVLTGFAGSWTSAVTPLPAGAASGPRQGATLSSLACPSSSSCLAVGSYEDSSGFWQGLLASGSGSSWTATESPLPANAKNNDANPQSAQFSSVACASAAICVAAGEYNDQSSHQQGLLVTVPS